MKNRKADGQGGNAPTITVSMSRGLLARLDAHAAQAGASRSRLVSEAVAQFLERGGALAPLDRRAVERALELVREAEYVLDGPPLNPKAPAAAPAGLPAPPAASPPAPRKMFWDRAAAPKAPASPPLATGEGVAAGEGVCPHCGVIGALESDGMCVDAAACGRRADGTE